jgi:hypothetical protein
VRTKIFSNQIVSQSCSILHQRPFKSHPTTFAVAQPHSVKFKLAFFLTYSFPQLSLFKLMIFIHQPISSTNGSIFYCDLDDVTDLHDNSIELRYIFVRYTLNAVDLSNQRILPCYFPVEASS